MMSPSFVKNQIHLYIIFCLSFILIGCQSNENSPIDIKSDEGSSEFYSGEKPESNYSNRSNEESNNEIISCAGAPPQRVKVGDRAYVSTKSDRLIVRKDGYKSATEIARLQPNTYFYIIGGPKCDDENNWTYWKIETDNGLTGWVSEGGDSIDYYFMAPAE